MGSGATPFRPDPTPNVSMIISMRIWIEETIETFPETLIVLFLNIEDSSTILEPVIKRNIASSLVNSRLKRNKFERNPERPL
jgi:hypothetical protein